MNRKIIISVPFNINLGIYSKDAPYIKQKFAQTFPLSQTSQWINRRLYLFIKYTVNSLYHQTNPNFLCLVRHTLETTSLIQSELSRYSPLPPHIIFTPYADEIIAQQMKSCDVLYHITLDSDNMYSSDFIQRLSQYVPNYNTQSIICQNGYIYNEVTGQVAQIFHTSPSFYAAIYTPLTFNTLFQQRLFESHWVAVNYPYEVLPGNNFCIVTHSNNIDNDFNSITKYLNARLIIGYEKEIFLKQWHI